MFGDTRINDILYSWSSVVIKIDGIAYAGVSKVNYGDSRERAYGYGQGKNYGPQGQTGGKYTPDPVQLTLRLDSARLFLKALAAKGAGSFGDASFDISVQYIETASSLVPVNDLIIGCRLSKVANAAEEKPDAATQDFEATCLRVLWDEGALYSRLGGDI